MNRTKLFIATGICISLFFKTSAQEIELDPVTVVSSLTQRKISETGRNIVTINGENFHKLPVHSIDELLRYVPGVEVQMRGPAGSQSDIVIRGGTFQQVLIILDGIRLNDPNTGHFNSYIPISPDEIEKVEILKGASSALYGSEAVGGVINIITKTFGAKRRETKKHLGIQTTTGEYNLVNASLGGYYQTKNTAIGAGLLSNNSDGQPQRGTRGYFNNRTASLSFRQFIGENWSVAARSSFDLRDFSAQNFYTTFVSDTAKEKVNSNWNQLQINFRKNKHQLNIDAGYKNVKDWFEYNPSSVANNNRSYLFQVSVSDVYHIANSTHLVSGVQYQHKWIRSNDRGDHVLNQGALFLLLNQSLKDFSFGPSLRVDYSEPRGTEFVPQANLSWHKNKFQLRGNVSKTIRDANFTERYNNYNKPYVSGGSIGNPALQAERSFSYEAGADYFASKELKLSATLFQRRQSNVIDWVTTPYNDMPRKDNLSPAGTYALARNISKVNTTGAELDAQYVHLFSDRNSITTTLGLVYLRSRMPGITPSFYISSHARFLSNLTLQYITRYLGITTTAIYKNRKPQSATAIDAHVDENCFMMNAKLEGFILHQRLSVYTEADNLFNNKYADLLGSRAPGRWIMAGMKLFIRYP